MDRRDDQYPMLAALPPPTGRLIRYWNDGGWWGDQFVSPRCVGYAWAHWLEDGPVTHPGPPPTVDPVWIYQEAQRLDEWPGEAYDGTSVRGGAKALRAAGRISEYRWAWDIETLIRAVLDVGPVVVGTLWYSGMFQPDMFDVIRPIGSVVGGHAYVINGVNLKRGLLRMKNSWGRSWGGDGRAMIEIEDFDRLLREDGEACLAIEVPSA